MADVRGDVYGHHTAQRISAWKHVSLTPDDHQAKQPEHR